LRGREQLRLGELQAERAERRTRRGQREHGAGTLAADRREEHRLAPRDRVADRRVHGRLGDTTTLEDVQRRPRRVEERDDRVVGRHGVAGDTGGHGDHLLDRERTGQGRGHALEGDRPPRDDALLGDVLGGADPLADQTLLAVLDHRDGAQQQDPFRAVGRTDPRLHLVRAPRPQRLRPPGADPVTIAGMDVVEPGEPGGRPRAAR
jgi:hypothetical protein